VLTWAAVPFNIVSSHHWTNQVLIGASVPKFESLTQISLRFFAALLGLGLLGYLVFRAGSGVVWKQVHAVGWGLALIIILGGFSQLIRTCAWRQTFMCDIGGLSWSRSLGTQLASDACGQLGLAGKMLGDGIRVSMLGSTVPVASGISACAIEGGLHTLSAAVVTVLGIVAALLLAPLSGRWRIQGLLLAAVLSALVVLAAVAVANRWQLMGHAARAIGRFHRLHHWISGKQPTIDSAEHNLLAFPREAPRAFWAVLTLDLLWHATAVLEVYLILRFMGARIAVVGTLALEGLTKVINLVGALNPGNLGTYEGGNMLIAKMFGVTGTSGLTLALCRRARSIFWAGVGAMCMIVMKRAGRGKADSR
jgi:Lysylphosphatidylglycerol synthase TM region